MTTTSSMLTFDGLVLSPPLNNSTTFPLPTKINDREITAGQTFVVTKAACPNGCDALGRQTSTVQVVTASAPGLGQLSSTVFASALTTTVGTANLTYTLGDSTLVYGDGATLQLNGTGYIGEVAIAIREGGIFTAAEAVDLSKATPVGGAGLPSTTKAVSSPVATSGIPTASATNGPNKPNEPAATKSGGALSTGAVAGVAIGCAIVGALIGALLVFFLCRKSKTRKRSRNAVGLVEIATKDDDMYEEVKPRASSLITIVANSLPQATEDRQLEREMGTLYPRLHDHVDSFYDTTTPMAMTTVADVSALGPPMEITPSELASLISNPKTRASALVLCIAWTIMCRIDMFCDPHTSFLPVEVSTILQQIQGAITSGDKVPTASFTLWRALTATLITAKNQSSRKADSHIRTASLSSTISSQPLPTANIRAALAALNEFLAPYASLNANGTARLQNLEEIMKRGARFGFLLFSQPGEWELQWGGRGDEAREVTLFPALVQTVGDDGDRLLRAREIRVREVMKR